MRCLFQPSSIFLCVIPGKAVHNRYNELKRRELTWEQFLTKVTVIDDEEARWDNSDRRDMLDSKRKSKRNDSEPAASKKKKAGLSD